MEQHDTPMSAGQGTVAPPTVPGPLARPEPVPAWPMVLGTISIVLGSIGTLQYGCNSLAAPFMGWVMNQVASNAPAGAPPGVFASMQAVGQFQGVTLVANLLGFGLAILLLTTGLGLVRRRPWAIRWSLVWATLKIIHGVLATVAGYLMARVQVQALTNDPNMPPVPPGFIQIAIIVGLSIALLFYVAYPMVLIIWLTRARIRSQVCQWAGAAGSINPPAPAPRPGP